MTATLPPTTGPQPGGPQPEAPLAAPRPAFTHDWRRIARMGSIAAFGQMFIALSNMPVRLDERLIIKPVLSLGYLVLLILPFAVGYRQGHQIKREGVPTYAPGMNEVVGGLSCGAWRAGVYRC